MPLNRLIALGFLFALVSIWAWDSLFDPEVKYWRWRRSSCYGQFYTVVGNLEYWHHNDEPGSCGRYAAIADMPGLATCEAARWHDVENPITRLPPSVIAAVEPNARALLPCAVSIRPEPALGTRALEVKQRIPHRHFGYETVCAIVTDQTAIQYGYDPRAASSAPASPPCRE